MEKEKNIEAQPSAENTNGHFTTVEECNLHIDDLNEYIAQLERQLDDKRKQLKKAEGDIEFYRGCASRQAAKKTLCLQLLKLSDNPLMVALADKIEKTYEI